MWKLDGVIDWASGNLAAQTLGMQINAQRGLNGDYNAMFNLMQPLELLLFQFNFDSVYSF